METSSASYVDVAQSRRRPLQTRSRRSVRKVLDAALEVLMEDGLPGLNTNKVAARAGVNVATVYSYFPDKLSIVRQLAEEFEQKRGDYIAEHARLLPDSSWPEWFDQVIDRLVQFRVEDPGGVALRRAIMSSPDLRSIDEASTDRAVEDNISGMLAHGSGLTEEHARIISRVVVITVTAILDAAFATARPDHRQIAELKQMVRSYLAHYLT
jgi:AcrR family transcriptional regulator